MVTRHWFVIWMLFFWVGSASANPSNSSAFFEEGLQSYKDKDFQAAELAFGQALKLQPLNAALLFDQALNYSQQKKWGLALAHLRQAQILDPRLSGLNQAFDFLNANLKSASTLQEDSLAADFHGVIGKYFLLPELLIVHWVLSLALLLTMTRLFRRRRRAKQRGEVLPTWQNSHWGVSFLWITASLVLLLKIHWSLDTRATVVAPGDTIVRSGPLPNAAELATIPEGAFISVTDFYKDWVQVRFNQRPVGWVPRKDIFLNTAEGLN